MEIKLSNAERSFLRKLVEPHYQYFELLSLNPRFTAGNRQRWELVKRLVTKLEPAAE